MLTAQQQSGRNLEMPVAKFMQKNNIQYAHNRFNDSDYPLGIGIRVDGLIKNSNGKDILIECTNPKASTWLTDDIMQKKIGYFNWIDALHSCLWLLIVSYANWSQQIWQQLNKQGIQVIILKTTATQHNHNHVIHSLYHTMLYRIVKSVNLIDTKNNLHQHRELEDDIPLEQLRAWNQHLEHYIKSKERG